MITVPFWLAGRGSVTPDHRTDLMDQFTGPVSLTEAVQTPVRVNVTCVTPLGEEVASTW
jgi:hypothetical protein